MTRTHQNLICKWYKRRKESDTIVLMSGWFHSLGCQYCDIILLHWGSWRELTEPTEKTKKNDILLTCEWHRATIQNCTQLTLFAIYVMLGSFILYIRIAKNQSNNTGWSGFLLFACDKMSLFPEIFSPVHLGRSYVDMFFGRFPVLCFDLSDKSFLVNLNFGPVSVNATKPLSGVFTYTSWSGFEN